jgi:tripartite-type tricarboxylate transporter receptor subunit TctC
MPTRFLPAVAAACLAGLVAAAVPAQAQNAAPFPTRPVKLVVGFAPGGSTDALARMLGAQLSRQWGQPVVVENRPGAGGNTGADIVSKAAPDGHTLLMFHDGLAANASLYRKLPFDPVQDLVPVSPIAMSAIVVGVAANVPVGNLKELIELAKSKPGGLTYSSCGVGTAHHIAGELFKSMAQIDMTHVAYKGCGPAIADTLGGHVPVFFQTLSNVADHIKSGRIRVLGVADATRVPAFPDIPTIGEAALPGFVVSPWYGVFAPKGAPKELVAKISADIAKAVATPEMQESLVQLYYRPRTATPDQFSSLVASDIDRLGTVIRRAGITAD